MKKLIALSVLPFLLAACGSSSTDGTQYGTYNSNADTEESTGSLNDTSYLLAPAPKFYIGNPYTVDGTTYTPAEDMTYDQTGMAGIVPASMNGVLTTNGETFDSNQMLGTSKTLPLPTIVKVTNLDNGNTAIVRVNNRGPFVSSRIMDLSGVAAKKLGMTGPTKVEVAVLADQSTQVKNATLAATGATTPATVVPKDIAPTYTAPVVTGGTGPYAVQAGAFYSQDKANALANQISSRVSNVKVVNEAGLFKVRISDLDAATARSTISTLRGDGLTPGLLNNGRWVNADSI